MRSGRKGGPERQGNKKGGRVGRQRCFSRRYAKYFHTEHQTARYIYFLSSPDPSSGGMGGEGEIKTPCIAPLHRQRAYTLVNPLFLFFWWNTTDLVLYFVFCMKGDGAEKGGGENRNNTLRGFHVIGVRSVLA